MSYVIYFLFDFRNFRPESLLAAYAASLRYRLLDKDNEWDLPSSDEEDHRNQGIAAPGLNLKTSTEAYGQLKKLSRYTPTPEEAASAALALALHRWQDASMFKLIERTAIQRPLNPAQISCEWSLS